MTELNHTLEGAPSPSGNLVEANYYVSGLGFVISTLFVFLRLYNRFRTTAKRTTPKDTTTKGIGWDDCFLFCSWAFSTAMQAPMLYAIQLKTMCYHHDDISPEKFKVYSELSYVAAPMFMLSIGCAKMSILFLYRRFENDEKAFQLALYTSMVAVSATTLTIAALLFVARPGTSSLDVVALFLATASSNIVMDIVLLVLPIPTIFGLQMSLKKKLLATAFFSLGLITTSISVVRLVLLKQLQGSSDLTWDAAPANITSFLEVNLHAICACVPELRKFFMELKWFPSTCRTDPTQPSEARTRPFDNSSRTRLRDGDGVLDLGLIEPRSVSTSGGSNYSGQTKEWWTYSV